MNLDKRSEVLQLPPLIDQEEDNMRRLLLSGQPNNVKIALRINQATCKFEKLLYWQKRAEEAVRDDKENRRLYKILLLEQEEPKAYNEILTDLKIPALPTENATDHHFLTLYVEQCQQLFREILRGLLEG